MNALFDDHTSKPRTCANMHPGHQNGVVDRGVILNLNVC
jgi:hypothetical protein